MRNLDVIKAFNNKEEQDFLFFYGHTNKTNSVNQTCLSQWYEDTEFEDDFAYYYTCEHYMMVHKSLTMNPKDMETVDKMIAVKSPGAVKKMGRQVKNYDQKKWNEKKFDIVVQGNYLKFSQDEDL